MHDYMSHISERGFWDTLEISTRPVIAGHSNSKAVCNVPRNLSDEQFAALVRRGGGAGINLYPEFLGLGRDIDAVFAAKGLYSSAVTLTVLKKRRTA